MNIWHYREGFHFYRVDPSCTVIRERRRQLTTRARQLAWANPPDMETKPFLSLGKFAPRLLKDIYFCTRVSLVCQREYCVLLLSLAWRENAQKKTNMILFLDRSRCIGLQSWRMEMNVIIINNALQSSARCGSGYLFLNQTKGKHKSWACKRGGTRSDCDTSFSLALTPKMFYFRYAVWFNISIVLCF